MHEISLVRSIFRTLEESLEPEALARMSRIDLHVGQLANVEPILMQNAFRAVQETDQVYTQVSLHMEIIPAEIYCAACQKYSLVENYVFQCACGKPSRDIVRGTELLIHQVHFAEERPVESGTA